MLKSLPTLPHVALIALIALAVTGCSKERTYPVYRENPAPKDALPIVIRVHDAPVDVPTPKITVSYAIDPLCLPPVSNYEGVQYEPKRHSVEFPVQRISANEFTSTVFKDGMEVADYYGRGPCTWAADVVQASFTFTVVDRSINASVPAFFPEIDEGEPSITYVEKALKPMIAGQQPESAWTETKTRFDKLPLPDQSKYFPIEISSRTEGVAP
ncbi:MULTISPECIES: hypothetical protein [Stenotrophomonas]|uniref:hypothetical protein n=1 Tax=Stenotrophomonas TaxID=40323 RepID=UPI000B6FC2DB|nr:MULTISPECIES: hypothetical protein [Stenotrophomonas]SMR70533.1 hypothetical protein SAMN04487863_1289 [Stenotrophomonas sp. yr243]SNT51203.1 hypothetical protein SAMN05518671_2623 [Stenotrophomonas lactitubi]